jgi:hypothetical protein
MSSKCDSVAVLHTTFSLSASHSSILRVPFLTAAFLSHFHRVPRAVGNIDEVLLSVVLTVETVPSSDQPLHGL